MINDHSEKYTESVQCNFTTITSMILWILFMLLHENIPTGWGGGGVYYYCLELLFSFLQV